MNTKLIFPLYFDEPLVILYVLSIDQQSLCDLQYSTVAADVTVTYCRVM